jgi:RNA polymerase sigma-70 factor (TIGR02960 family)
MATVLHPTGFDELVAPYRGELHRHIYRLTGSAQDAEDVLQETLLAAWRAMDGFQGRSSLRTWLFRIATNASLNALRARGRRPQPALAHLPAPTRTTEPLDLEPWHDALPAPAEEEPHARVEARETMALAFVAALQRLPARQRAVLILRDVLDFSAAEAAEVLGASVASVNSALQRARATLGEDRAPAPAGAADDAVALRFATAFERGDVDALVALLADDVVLTMPPEPLSYEGRADVRRLLEHVVRGEREVRMTSANGSPALVYRTSGRVAGLLVLEVEGDRVRRLTRFGAPGVLARFSPSVG